MLFVNQMINGKPFVILTTRTNLATLCPADCVLMDGTFKSYTKFFCQINGMYAHINGYYIPVAFTLLSDKSRDSYNTVIAAYHLIVYCTAAAIGQCLSPHSVLTDFEQSTSLSSIQNMLFNSELMCCRFHLGQSWLRQIQQLGLGSVYKDKQSG